MPRTTFAQAPAYAPLCPCSRCTLPQFRDPLGPLLWEVRQLCIPHGRGLSIRPDLLALPQEERERIADYLDRVGGVVLDLEEGPPSRPLPDTAPPWLARLHAAAVNAVEVHEVAVEMRGGVYGWVGGPFDAPIERSHIVFNDLDDIAAYIRHGGAS